MAVAVAEAWRWRWRFGAAHPHPQPRRPSHQRRRHRLVHRLHHEHWRRLPVRRPAQRPRRPQLRQPARLRRGHSLLHAARRDRHLQLQPLRGRVEPHQHGHRYRDHRGGAHDQPDRERHRHRSGQRRVGVWLKQLERLKRWVHAAPSTSSKSSAAATLTIRGLKTVHLKAKHPTITFTVTLSKATLLHLTLTTAKVKKLAGWTKHESAGKHTIALLLPVKARHAGRDKLRITETGNPTARTVAVTIAV